MFIIYSRNELNHYPKILKINNIYLKFAFKDEILALNLLQDNYRCTCEPKRKHFPVIMFSIPINPYIYIIAMNDKGESLGSNGKQTHKKIIPDISQQCKCINENLERSNVRHLDLHLNNVCVDGNGTISLIDFGCIIINDTCKYNCYLNGLRGIRGRPYDSLENLISPG